MIDKEFNQWWADVKIRFPDMVHWFATGKEIDEQRASFRTWLEILADVPLEDALAANRQLQADGLRLNIDQLPALVRSRAGQRQAQREAPSPELVRRLKFHAARKLHTMIVEKGRLLQWTRQQLLEELRQQMPADYFHEVCSGPSVAELRKRVGV